MMRLTETQSRMRYMLPSLYVAFQEDWDAQMEDDDAQPNRACEEQWENNLQVCRSMMDTLPSVARNFIEIVPCLHDWRYSFLAKGSNAAAFLVTPEGWKDHEHLRWKLYFTFEEMSERQVFKDERADEARADINEDDTGFLLYDEFHFDDDKLSWHFFDTYGREFSFDGIQSILWDDVSGPRSSEDRAIVS